MRSKPAQDFYMGIWKEVKIIYISASLFTTATHFVGHSGCILPCGFWFVLERDSLCWLCHTQNALQLSGVLPCNSPETTQFEHHCSYYLSG